MGKMVADFDIFHPVNPFSKQHGAQSDSERHVGDLGNYETDAQGNAKGSITDQHIKLFGQESVLGVRLLPTNPNRVDLESLRHVLIPSTAYARRSLRHR